MVRVRNLTELWGYDVLAEMIVITGRTITCDAGDDTLSFASSDSSVQNTLPYKYISYFFTALSCTDYSLLSLCD